MISLRDCSDPPLLQLHWKDDSTYDRILSATLVVAINEEALLPRVGPYSYPINRIRVKRR
ncbi:MAG: hypothetical protein CBD18_05245 [Opitutales bacterium TMED158]|nr:MAG: hypothetical protein CBD18_05245 [Opitutales bacterium TMED158]